VRHFAAKSRLGSRVARCVGSSALGLSKEEERMAGGLSTSEHWLLLDQGILTIPRCDSCGEWSPVTARLCVACSGNRLVWRRVTGTGTVRAVYEPAPADQLSPSAARTVLIALEEGPDLIAVLRGGSSPVGASMVGRSAQWIGMCERSLPIFALRDWPGHIRRAT
jgi:uncharacterized OB-fold protein